MWPEDETFDRSQSLLYLGVATAREGDFQQGYKFALNAVALHNQPHLSYAKARALLEAAVMAMHAGRYPQALRCLIEVHSTLVERGQARPEWAVLAQCALLLAGPSESALQDADLPIPGFTLGLRDTIPGAEKMLPMAPTLMLGRACAVWGRPHRGLAYLEDALAKIDDPETTTTVT